MSIGKLAIVVGHTAKYVGAFAVAPLSLHEYHYNLEVARLIAQFAPQYDIEAMVFLRKDSVGDRGETSLDPRRECYMNVNRYLNGIEHAAIIELHFNSFSDPSVHGTETLYQCPSSETFATYIQGAVCVAFNRIGGENRHTKLLKDGDRGHYNLSLAEAPAVIVEPFFGTNGRDAEMGKNLKAQYAEALCIGTEIFLRAL